MSSILSIKQEAVVKDTIRKRNKHVTDFLEYLYHENIELPVTPDVLLRYTKWLLEGEKTGLGARPAHIREWLLRCPPTRDSQGSIQRINTLKEEAGKSWTNIRAEAELQKKRLYGDEHVGVLVDLKQTIKDCESWKRRWDSEKQPLVMKRKYEEWWAKATKHHRQVAALLAHLGLRRTSSGRHRSRDTWRCRNTRQQCTWRRTR